MDFNHFDTNDKIEEEFDQDSEKAQIRAVIKSDDVPLNKI